jgi:hypothetical protein
LATRKSAPDVGMTTITTVITPSFRWVEATCHCGAPRFGTRRHLCYVQGRERRREQMLLESCYKE